MFVKRSMKENIICRSTYASRPSAKKESNKLFVFVCLARKINEGTLFRFDGLLYEWDELKK